MERSELYLRDWIKEILENHSLEDILEMNDTTVEDTLVFLYLEFGLRLPEKFYE